MLRAQLTTQMARHWQQSESGVEVRAKNMARKTICMRIRQRKLTVSKGLLSNCYYTSQRRRILHHQSPSHSYQRCPGECILDFWDQIHFRAEKTSLHYKRVLEWYSQGEASTNGQRIEMLQHRFQLLGQELPHGVSFNRIKPHSGRCACRTRFRRATWSSRKDLLSDIEDDTGQTSRDIH